STQLAFITRALPRIRWFPGAEGGFNANEIAGALAWLTPLMAGLAFYRGRWPLVRIAAAVGFWLLLLALFLCQQRLAIIGVVAALAGIIFLVVPPGRRRYIALFGLALFIAAEVAVVKNVFNSGQAQRLEDRDEISTYGRLDIWRSALNIVHDYPLTG